MFGPLNVLPEAGCVATTPPSANRRPSRVKYVACAAVTRSLFGSSYTTLPYMLTMPADSNCSALSALMRLFSP